MKLRLERLQLDPDCTIGALFVDGTFDCWTLEDTVRPDGVKIAGETAVPFGTYAIDITQSPRFGRLLPLLIGVHNFVGIRIHPGNTAHDTEGCILVGSDRHHKWIGKSKAAFDTLFPKLRDAKARGERIAIEIVKP